MRWAQGESLGACNSPLIIIWMAQACVTLSRNTEAVISACFYRNELTPVVVKRQWITGTQRFHFRELSMVLSAGGGGFSNTDCLKWNQVGYVWWIVISFQSTGPLLYQSTHLRWGLTFMNYDGFTADKKTLSSKKRLKWHLRVYLANLKICRICVYKRHFFCIFCGRFTFAHRWKWFNYSQAECSRFPHKVHKLGLECFTARFEETMCRSRQAAEGHRSHRALMSGSFWSKGAWKRSITPNLWKIVKNCGYNEFCYCCLEDKKESMKLFARAK